MAANIRKDRNGRYDFAYCGKKPWHGTGQEMEPGAPMEEWREASGFGFRILAAYPRYATSADATSIGDLKVIEDRRILFRDDTGDDLSYVSDQFEIVQPADIHALFCRLVERQQGVPETAGVLGGGTKFFMLARLAEGVPVIDEKDLLKPYLLLTTSCDGSLPTTGKRVCTRVECENRLTMALSEKSDSTVKIRHRREFSIEEMENRLSLTDSQNEFGNFIENMRNLAKTALEAPKLVQMTFDLFRPGVLAAGDKAAIDKCLTPKAPITSVLDLAVRHSGLIGADKEGMRGTAYGWLQAATQYIDHGARAQSPANRFDSAMWGRGETLKLRALEMAQEAARGAEPSYQTSGDLMAELLARPSTASQSQPSAPPADSDFAALVSRPASTIF